MTDTDASKLKELALAANSGLWSNHYGQGYFVQQSQVVSGDMLICDSITEFANAAYIARANPATILDLLAERESLLARVEELERAPDVYYNMTNQPIMIVTAWHENPSGGTAIQDTTYCVDVGHGIDMAILGMARKVLDRKVRMI